MVYAVNSVKFSGEKFFNTKNQPRTTNRAKSFEEGAAVNFTGAKIPKRQAPLFNKLFIEFADKIIKLKMMNLTRQFEREYPELFSSEIFKKILKENPQLFKPADSANFDGSSPVFYHGTSEGACEKIKKQGFRVPYSKSKRKPPHDAEFGPAIYLTPKEEVAQKHGSSIIKAKVYTNKIICISAAQWKYYRDCIIKPKVVSFAKSRKLAKKEKIELLNYICAKFFTKNGVEAVFTETETLTFKKHTPANREPQIAVFNPLRIAMI